MKAIRAFAPERLAQAWLVPRWTMTSPARTDRLALVQDEDELAFEDDSIVDRLGAVHQRVGRVLGECVAGADRLEQGADRFPGQGGHAAVVGRDVEDPDPGAAARRKQGYSGLGRLARGAVDRRRGRARVPNLVEGRAAVAAKGHHPRRRSVFLDDRAAPAVMAGDDPAGGLCHMFSVSGEWGLGAGKRQPLQGEGEGPICPAMPAPRPPRWRQTMKTYLAAAALAAAFPAAAYAQAGPAPAPKAEKACCCCEKMGRKMECCEEHGKRTKAPRTAPRPIRVIRAVTE